MSIADSLTESIIGAAIDVHKALGPGLLEFGYEECLSYEVAQRAIMFQRQVALPIVYKDYGWTAAIGLI